jgi:hypothetical protein
MASSDQRTFSDDLVVTLPARNQAGFHIFGWIQRYGPSKYAVTVESFLAGEKRDQLPTDVLAEMSPSVLEAQDTLRRLTITLGARIRGRGAVVIAVNTNDDP